jgi:hypothetical protein
LGFEQEIVEGTKSVGAFIEAGIAAFDGLFDHGTPDAFVFLAFLADGLERFDNEIEGILERGGLGVRFVRFIGSGEGR